MSKVYNLPEWAATDLNDICKQEYSLEILKDGVIIDNIDLNNVNKSYYILGRQPDIVDIQMDHPSISRQHAILQYRNDNCLMIMDWQSAQGTFVNKIQLEKDLYQRLYVGDMIKFGCSTRMYILNGPDEQSRKEYDSVGMQQYREKLIDNSNKIKEKEKESCVASWGFGEDAPQEDDDYYEDKQGKNDGEKDLPAYIKNDKNYDRKYADKYNVELDESEVTEKDKQLLEKIRTKERKIQNMQEENRRIYMKDGQEGGLTENQLKTVARNDDNINQHMEQIEILVAQLKDKNLQRQKQSTLSKAKEEKGRIDDDDNDNIRDTTNETADQGTNWRLRKKLAKTSTIHSATNEKKNDGYTYDDLCKEKSSIELTLNDLQNQINIKNEIIKNTRINDNETDIEAYIKNTNINEAVAKLKVLETSYNDTTTKLNNIESLIKIAAPALPSLKQSKLKDVSEAAALLSSEERIDNTDDNIQRNDDIEIAATTNIPVKMQPPKKDRVNYGMQSLSSLMEFIESEKKQETEVNDNQLDHDTIKRVRQREPDNLVHHQNKKLKGPIGPSLPQENDLYDDSKSEKLGNNVNSFNDNEISWKPPSNQDGSGITSLNAKFGY